MELDQQPKHFESASPLKRLAAAVIDFFLVSIVLQFFVDPALMEKFEKQDYNIAPEILFKFLLTGIAIFFVINFVLLISRQQTFGKLAMKIAISRLNDEKPSSFQILVLRYLLQFIVALIAPYLTLIDLLAIIFRGDHLAFHDLISKTKVIDLKKPSQPANNILVV